jgi:hypothetical protein
MILTTDETVPSGHSPPAASSGSSLGSVRTQIQVLHEKPARLLKSVWQTPATAVCAPPLAVLSARTCGGLRRSQNLTSVGLKLTEHRVNG